MTVDVHAETRSASLSPRAAEQDRGGFALPGWRPLLAGPVVAALTMVAALVTTGDAGVPLRDPDNVTGNRLVMAVSLILGAVRPRHGGARLAPLGGAPADARGARRRPARALDARAAGWPSAARSSPSTSPTSPTATSRASCRCCGPAISSTRQLADLDRGLFFGHDPAALLHDAVGTGLATHVFSGVYMLFFLFIPGTLAVALVFSRNLRSGLFYATALSLNWLLGAASYFLLPSLGPIYAEPGAFSALAGTDAGRLQAILLEQRTEFLRDPALGTAQSIGAFASLHVSIFVTAALAAHLLGLRRSVKVVAWILVALTVGATIHLGWHYVVDDFGGVVIAVLALALARAAHRRRPARRCGQRGRDDAGPADLARRLGRRAGGRRDRRRGRARHGLRRPAAARPRPRRGALPRPGRPRRRAARRRSTSRCAPARAPAAAGRRARRWPPSGASAGRPTRLRRRGRRAGRLLRHLHGLPQPEGDRPAAAARRQLRRASWPTSTAACSPATTPRRCCTRCSGTGVVTHVLSAFYVAFIVFLPLTIGVALVFATDLRPALFYVTAQSINWVLGIVSYFLLPSLGPIYFDPAPSRDLPDSEVTRLQGVLLRAAGRLPRRPGDGRRRRASRRSPRCTSR